MSGFNLNQGAGGTEGGNESSTVEPPAPSNEGGQQQDPESLASPFLSNIPEEDRPVVEKYVKDWDAGVTKRFQSIHDQYRPYKELGEAEELQKAVQLMNVFQEDPQRIYQILAQEFGQSGPVGNEPSSQESELGPEFEGLPEQFVTKFQEQQTMLENMAQVVLDLRNSTQQNDEDAQLEKTLQTLKAQHPDVDETYALSQLYAGKSPEDIGNGWSELKKSLVEAANNRRPAPPPILNGGGVIADTNKSVTDLSSKETRDLVAKAVAAAQNDS